MSLSRPKPRAAKVVTSPKVALKPCPFCGSPGYVGQWIMSTFWSVGCSNKQGMDCAAEFNSRFETNLAALRARKDRS